MIQLELTDDDTEQMALVCDRCGRAWYRQSGETNTERLRTGAAVRGWAIGAIFDVCPRCVKKIEAERRKTETESNRRNGL